MKIEIKSLYDDDKLIPQYATSGSAAMDLKNSEAFSLQPGEDKLIKTGIALFIGAEASKNVCGLILPRSGMGSSGLVLKNTVGLIDADYQGEIMLRVWNTSFTTLNVEKYTKIAQIMFINFENVELVRVNEFSRDTSRGIGGFGSTGDK